MAGGFVYILENESMPGILKIGMTTRNPLHRAEDLYTTGVPSPFTVAFAMYSDNARHAEMLVHDELDHLRWSLDREFFKIELPEAIACVFDACKPTDQTVVHCDYAIDPGLLNCYARMCGLCPPDIVRLLDFFTADEWKSAANRLRQKLHKINQAKNLEVNNDIHATR